MPLTLFTCSIVIIFCIIAQKLSDKIGVPTLLLFILLGMVFGSDGILKIQFENYKIAEEICSITLIFIMFYGGFGTNWKMARPVALQSFLLASAGVAVTAGLVGLFCCYILGFPFLESMLIGSVISSTDAASVFSIFRSKNLNLKHGLASMLELESGSNDPTAYMLTALVLGLMSGGGNQSIPYMLFAQVVFGLIVGASIAGLSMYVLDHNDFSGNGMDTILVVALALLAYSFAGIIGGNGYLSVYVAGIILGNSRIRNKVTLVHFFDGLTGLMQILLFFLLGLLASPTQLPQYLVPALMIFLFMTFIARPLTVTAILSPFKADFKQLLLISWAGLRGAASIVFAIMVTVSDGYQQFGIFNIVFCIALLSVLFQGTLLPVVAQKLDLVDDENSIMKTFNDYIDETSMELMKEEVGRRHTWIGKRIRDIDLPPNSLVIMIERGQNTVIPHGKTVIKEGDVIVFNCEKYTKSADMPLSEVEITETHPWKNRLLKDVQMDKGALVVMIMRDGDRIIPNGDTRIEWQDVLVLNEPVE